MQSKSWWASKTLWFNILAFIAAIASAFGYTGELSPEWAVFVPAIIAIVNVLLRLMVKQEIAGPVARALRRE